MHEKCPITAVTLAVLEHPDDEVPFLEMRVRGLRDGVDGPLPPDFRNTAPYNPNKISVKVVCVQDGDNDESLADMCADAPCPSPLHLLLVQLLGGTNKALAKIPDTVATQCIDAIKDKLTLIDSDAVF